jgi:hypothetical protein
MRTCVSRHFVALVISFGLCLPARAAIITQYAAPGGSFAPTTVAVGATASPLNETGSAADLQPGATFPNTVFLQQNVVSTTPAQAVSNNQFFQFTVAPQSGRAFNLTDFTFDASRGGASTPRGWVLRSSQDGFGSTIATADVPTQQPTLTSFSASLASPNFQNIMSPLTFRLYGYAPQAGVGMFYDNLTLNGTVTGFELARYEAPGSSFSPTFVAPHILAGALNDTGSAADLQPGATLPNSVFLQQNVVSTTPAAAVSNNQFFQFSLAPESGFSMDVLSLSFDAGRGGASTPRGWALRSSLDGFLSDLATSDVNSQQPTLTAFDIDLPDLPFQDLTSEVTFRLYGYAPGAGVGMFYDNLRIFGFAEPVVAGSVPEPHAWALLALALAGLGIARRRGTVIGDGR